MQTRKSNSAEGSRSPESCNFNPGSSPLLFPRTRMLLPSLCRARWTTGAKDGGHWLATTRDRLQRSEAMWHNVNGLRAIPHTTWRPASIRDNAHGSAAVGYTREWPVAAARPTAHRLAVVDEGTHRPVAARHKAHRPTGCWVADTRDDGRSWKIARALTGSGNIASRRATGVFIVAGFMAAWLASGAFSKGLRAVVHEPGMILTVAGYAEDLSTSHVWRTEGNGRRGSWEMAGASKWSWAAVSRAVVTASHGERLRALEV